MPNLLRKKRRSASESTIAVPEENGQAVKEGLSELPPMPPSPSSSRTAVSASARSPIAFVPLVLTPKKKSSSSSLKKEKSSSPSILKVTKRVVKKSMKRLDEALHLAKPRAGTRRAVSMGSPSPAVAEEEEESSKPSRLRTLSTSIRKRTISTSDSPFFSRNPRQRTTSCPTVPSPMDEQPALPPSSLRSVEEEVAAVTSPVQPEAEDEVPDPFLLDEEGDALSSEEGRSPLPPSASKPLPSPNVFKDMPPPPPIDDDDSEDDEEEVPDLYVPGLVIPTMFLPIPNVRHSFSSNLLVWWLSKRM